MLPGAGSARLGTRQRSLISTIPVELGMWHMWLTAIRAAGARTPVAVLALLLSFPKTQSKSPPCLRPQLSHL